jgi:hypothetical protein
MALIPPRKLSPLLLSADYLLQKFYLLNFFCVAHFLSSPRPFVYHQMGMNERETSARFPPALTPVQKFNICFEMNIKMSER